MRIHEAIPVDVMIATFLKAEVNSVRFCEQILRLLARDHQDRHILDAPDLNDAEENVYRARLLSEWRGYGRNEDVFTDLPDDTQWFRAVLDEKDLQRVKYINCGYWNGFSGGSRYVRDAVARIHSGAIDAGEAACYRMFAQDLEKGATFTELILLYNPRTDELVVLEGHIRITSYLLWLGLRPTELPILLGVSEHMNK